MLRGGGWISSGRNCRSAARIALEPDGRNAYFGFRLARGLADQSDQPRHFEFGQPEAGGAEPPGISRSPEGGAPPPKAAENLKTTLTDRLKTLLGFGRKGKS